MQQPMIGAVWMALASMVACGTGGEANRQDRQAAQPEVVSLSTANYVFQAPDSVNAGWTTFRFTNQGDDIHYAHIVRLDSGRTVVELVNGYAEAIRTSGPRPAWLTRFGGPGAAAPGDSSVVTQNLEPGSYVWICPVEDTAGNPHFGKGEYKTFEVRGTPMAGDAAAPVASTTIRLVDYAFVLEAPLQAGRQTIRVHNTGPEPHDINLLKLAPGRTLEDIRHFLNPERARRPGQADDPGPPLPSLGSPAGGVATLAPGMEAFLEVNLTPGDYVLACMVTSPDGKAHIEHGMIQQIKVQ